MQLVNSFAAGKSTTSYGAQFHSNLLDPMIAKRYKEYFQQPVGTATAASSHIFKKARGSGNK